MQLFSNQTFTIHIFIYLRTYVRSTKVPICKPLCNSFLYMHMAEYLFFHLKMYIYLYINDEMIACFFAEKSIINMLESSPAAASGPSTSTMTTAQHQQMARQISSQADFAEEYFASLSVPAKRLIEVGTT